MVETLEEMFLRETSRRNTDLIVNMLNQKEELFDELIRIVLANREPVSRRAAWAADVFSEKNPEIIQPYLDQLINSLEQYGHEGLRRHSLRMISRCVLPTDDSLGILINICFDWLTSANVAVASKVFCMDILYRIAENEPDIRKELADTIDWRLAEETPGFRSHGLKILTNLNRLK